MVRYRGRVEIIADILNVASTRAKKTRIMYFANLSYALLEKYLPEVLKLEFISYDNECYEVTEKGRAFLEKYSSFSSKYSKFEGELQRMLFEREALEKLCTPMRSTASRSASLRRRRN